LNRKWFFRIALVTALLTISSGFWSVAPGRTASPAQQTSDLPIYFFWGDGCPHCAQEKPFLQELVRHHQRVTLLDYEVWYVPENMKLMKQMATALGFKPSGVPVTIIGDRYWVGYTTQIGAEIEAQVNECLDKGCPDRGVGIIPGRKAPENERTSGAGVGTPASSTITLPLR